MELSVSDTSRPEPAGASTDSAWRITPLSPWVAAPSVAVLIGLLAVANRYGFHRDELYFIESMEHPAWGYVDNPPLTPAIGWISRQVFGDTLFGLRVLPAVQVAVVVLVVALLARELGGGRRAQVLAAVVTATASFFLAIGHLLTTPTFDVLATCVILLGLCRIVRTGDQRWWIGIGVAIGVGLQNKFTLLLVLASLAAAALLTGTWRRLVSWWTLAGAAVALVIWLPQLLWQFDHDWPQLDFARALAEQEGGENRATLVLFQLLILGPPLVPIVIAGIWSLWRRPSWRPVRFVAVGYVVLLGVLLATGGKGYYAAGLFGALIAAGSIATVDWVDRGSVPVRASVVGAGLVVNAVVGVVVTMPILPERFVDGPIGAVNEDTKETIGWPAFVEQVAAVADRESMGDRSPVVIVTTDYGTAGAIDRFGAEHGLGPAHSPHNSYADFRQPPAQDAPVLVIGEAGANPAWFEECERLATIATPGGIDNEIDGMAIRLCAAPAEPWSELWPKMRRLS